MSVRIEVYNDKSVHPEVRSVDVSKNSGFVRVVINTESKWPEYSFGAGFDGQNEYESVFFNSGSEEVRLLRLSGHFVRYECQEKDQLSILFVPIDFALAFHATKSWKRKD